MNRPHTTVASLLAASLLTAAALAAQPPTPAPTPKPTQEPAKAPTSEPTKSPAKSTPPPATAGRIDLRPKWELGQVVRYTMKQTSDQQTPNAEDPKDPHKSRLEQTVGLKMTAKAVDAQTGEATVEIVYETVKAKLDGGIANVDFDSTRPAPKTPKKPADPLDEIDNLVADQFKQMVGTTITMKVARDGRITSTTGGESLSPTMIPGLAIPAAEAMKHLGGLIGPITTNSTPGFDGLARIGDRWTHRDQLDVGPIGGLDLTTTYDLRTHAASVAKVYFKGHADGNRSSGQPQPVGLDSSDYSGLYAWDTRRGQLAHCELEQKVTMSGSLTGGKPATSTTAVVIDRVDKR